MKQKNGLFMCTCSWVLPWEQKRMNLSHLIYPNRGPYVAPFLVAENCPCSCLLPISCSSCSLLLWIPGFCSARGWGCASWWPLLIDFCPPTRVEIYGNWWCWSLLQCWCLILCGWGSAEAEPWFRYLCTLLGLLDGEASSPARGCKSLPCVFQHDRESGGESGYWVLWFSSRIHCCEKQRARIKTLLDRMLRFKRRYIYR